MTDEVLVVGNTTLDKRFADNPFVTGPPNIRFYAGVPLSDIAGFRVGTLCIIDYEPRELTKEQKQVLTDLAQVVVGEMKLRVATQETLKDKANSLNESERRFLLAFEDAPVGMAFITPEGKRFKVNQALADFLGYTVEELTNSDMQSTNADQAALEQSMKLRQQVIDGEITTFRNERRYRHKDGHIVWGEVTGILSRNEAGEPEYFVAHTVDITERKAAQARSERLTTAINQLDESVVLFDEDDRVVVANEMWKELNKKIADYTIPGTRFEDHLRAGIKRGLFPESAGREKEWLSERMGRHHNPTGPFVVARQDSRWIRIHEQKLPDGGTILIISDISELKQSEEAYKNSESQLHEVLNNSPIGVAIVTHSRDNQKPAGERLFVNKALARMFGAQSTDELINADISKSWVDHNRLLEAEEIMKPSKNLINFEAKRRRLNGDEWWVSMNSRPIVFNGIHCTMNWHSDITERKEAEAALHKSHYELEKRVHARTIDLEKARNEAEIANVLKSQLITTMNHELRTPLTSIVGSLRLLSSGTMGPIPENAKDLLNVATRNSDQLAILVNDILDIERLHSGIIEIEMHPLNLTVMVEQAVKLNAGYGEEYGVIFVTKDLTDEINISGDETRLLQVMANLLSNAAKFSPTGETVTISIDKSENIARVSVSDNGRGIPEELRKTIFDKFVRGDNIDARNTGGAGLGLNITKAIIEQHGGTIGFNTEVGVGSTFFFTLPILE